MIEPRVINPQLASKYNTAKREITAMQNSLKLTSFLLLRTRLEEKAPFFSEEIRATKSFIRMTLKVEWIAGTKYRVLLGGYSDKPHLKYLSYCFDRIIITINGVTYRWDRNFYNLESSGIEVVVDVKEFPLEVSFCLFIDPLVPYYIVPQKLEQIVQEKFANLPTLHNKIANYCKTNNLYFEDLISCDFVLEDVFKVRNIPKDQLINYLHSVLIPVHPIQHTVYLTKAKELSFEIEFPNIEHLFNSVAHEEEINLFGEYNSAMEEANMFAAIEQNPVEAIEAEIANHSLKFDLLDDGHTEKTELIDAPFTPAKRSTVFFSQPWVNRQSARFLDENRRIHERYVTQK